MGCINSSMISHSDARSDFPIVEYDDFSKTRILQNEVVDHCIVDPADSERKNQWMAAGKFIDGLLGVCDTAEIAEKLSKLPRGKLFEDEDFPADSSSLYFSDSIAVHRKEVTWKRPFEICKDPCLFANGISKRDVKQGIIGNCWFLSACTSVGARQDLIEKVIDPSQRLSGEGYHGALLINFWRFGEWVTVNIDDRLPTENGNLIFASCINENEFWMAMIEKAYAKLHGSYEALIGGHALEAFVDLTGGIAETVRISSDCFERLVIMYQRGAFMTGSIKAVRSNRKECNSKGLIEGQTYIVTHVRHVKLLNGEMAKLVGLRNPWGNTSEWEGTWNDRSSNWNQVSKVEGEELKIMSNRDGGFWMEFDDFTKEFEEVTIVTIGPNLKPNISIDSPTEFAYVKSSWRKGINAGGCRNDLEKFALNPQYLLHLKESDRFRGEERCCLLFGLMQEHRRSEKNKKLAMMPIAFFIYRVDGPITEKLGAEYFLCIPEESKSGDFTDSREVVLRTDLEPGYYVIIPATFHADSETNFMIRVFASNPFILLEITDNEGIVKEGNNNSISRMNFP